jgi:hypothetical protein
MRIESIEVEDLSALSSPFETSGWREQGSHAIIVRMQADGLSAGEAPSAKTPLQRRKPEECLEHEDDPAPPRLVA